MALWKRIDGFLRGLLPGRAEPDPPEARTRTGAAPGAGGGSGRPAFLRAAGPPRPATRARPEGPGPLPPERRAPLERVGALSASLARVRFVLSVDRSGEYLVVVGDRATIGHARAARADLPFLADVGTLHAEVLRVDSLREGPRFCLFPLEDAREGACEVEGRAVGSAGTRLFDGDRCRLGQNLAFRIRIPDPASHTALLELLDGAECAGARTIVLLGEGEGGRLRVGSAGRRHVRVAGLEEELELVAEPRGAELRVRSRGGLAGAGVEPAPELSFPLPLARRVDLTLPGAQRSGPPFVVALLPPDLPGKDPGAEGGTP